MAEQEKRAAIKLLFLMYFTAAEIKTKLDY
jgi:hypothetical protein